MQREDAEELARSWAKAVESGAAGAFETLVSPDVTDVSGQAPVLGQAPFEARSRAIHAAFRSIAVTVDQVLVDGERLAWRFTLRAEHCGPFLGIEATGKEVTVRGVNFQRIEHGRVREHWTLLDRFDLLQQLRSSRRPVTTA